MLNRTPFEVNLIPESLNDKLVQCSEKSSHGNASHPTVIVCSDATFLQISSYTLHALKGLNKGTNIACNGVEGN